MSALNYPFCDCNDVTDLISYRFVLRQLLLLLPLLQSIIFEKESLQNLPRYRNPFLKYWNFWHLEAYLSFRWTCSCQSMLESKDMRWTTFLPQWCKSLLLLLPFKASVAFFKPFSNDINCTRSQHSGFHDKPSWYPTLNLFASCFVCKSWVVY